MIFITFEISYDLKLNLISVSKQETISRENANGIRYVYMRANIAVRSLYSSYIRFRKQITTFFFLSLHGLQEWRTIRSKFLCDRLCSRAIKIRSDTACLIIISLSDDIFNTLSTKLSSIITR